MIHSVTVTGLAAYYRQVGQEFEIRAAWTAGTVAAATASMTLPGGASLDTTSLPITGNTTSNIGSYVGTWVADGAGNASALGAVCTADGTSAALLYFGQNAGSTAHLVPQLGNALVVSSKPVTVLVKVPISGI